eukprot:s47_g55.t1
MPQSFEQVIAQGITPPSNGGPLAMTPPGSPEAIPVSTLGHQSIQVEDSSATAVVRQRFPNKSSKARRARKPVTKPAGNRERAPNQTPTKRNNHRSTSTNPRLGTHWRMGKSIVSALDLLGTQLGPREVEKTRDVQVATLLEKVFAIPPSKCEMSRKHQLFQTKSSEECAAAGSNYRKEFEEVAPGKLARQGYQFQRGKRDPKFSTCPTTRAKIVHQVDDLRVTAAESHLEFLLSKQGLGKFLDMKMGKILAPGAKVNMLGRTKVRTQHAIFTFPKEKHRDNILTFLDLRHAKPWRIAGRKIRRTDANTKVLAHDKLLIYPGCVRSAIDISIDRRDIRFEVKELARHMKEPGEAETRALSRGVRNIMFVNQLGEEDFGLKFGTPRMWTDASTALQTAKRPGPSTKIRHIDVPTLFVQEFQYQKFLKASKIAGTANPSNCLT